MPDPKVLEAQLKGLDEKYRLLLNEAEKRNEQRFEAQQIAITTAMIAQEKAVLAAMTSAEKAVTKAELAAERRFESVNEFRQTLSDQTNSFLTRNEYTAQHTAATDRISSIEQQLVEIRGKSAGKSDLWGVLAGVIAIVLSLATVVILILTK